MKMLQNGNALIIIIPTALHCLIEMDRRPFPLFVSPPLADAEPHLLILDSRNYVLFHSYDFTDDHLGRVPKYARNKS